MWSSSGLPDISKCCCCISLQVGAYLIGILQLLFGLSFMILMRNFTDKQTEENTHFVSVIGIFFILLAVMLLLGLTIASTIKNFLLLKVYIVLEILRLVVAFSVTIILIIAVHSFGADPCAVLEIIIIIVIVAILFAVIALNIYFLLCINSYLKELIKLEITTSTNVGYENDAA